MKNQREQLEFSSEAIEAVSKFYAEYEDNIRRLAQYEATRKNFENSFINRVTDDHVTDAVRSVRLRGFPFGFFSATGFRTTRVVPSRRRCGRARRARICRNSS